ncbi:MAG TPA: VCBS repeat-containing protein, partial [Bryobacterales bacterium]|nr:VCBS repeat-containing protein [Bryobacterales bacterium]
MDRFGGRMKKTCLFAFLLLAAGGAVANDLPVFTDVTREAGIDFKHSYGDFDLSNIVEGTGSGACFFDYDNDGYHDLYLVNGAWTRGVSDNRGRRLRGKLWNHLYRNNGDGTFTDVTEASGAGDQTFSSGCSAADYDNDGDVDLYVLNYGPNKLYRNNGDGTFTDVSKQAGIDFAGWSLHAVWFDYDGDGWLDVYVANYLQYDEGKFRDFYAAQGYPGPLSYPGEADVLYR